MAKMVAVSTPVLEGLGIILVDLSQVFKEDTFGKHVWLTPDQEVSFNIPVKFYKSRFPLMRIFRVVEEREGFKHVIINSWENL